MKPIFFSYSRNNTDHANRLEQRVHKWGYEVIRDPPLVEGDPFWRDKVCVALKRCLAMLILWSQSSANSPWVEHEIRSFYGPKVYLPVDSSAPSAPGEKRVLAENALRDWLAALFITASTNQRQEFRENVVNHDSLMEIRNKKIEQEMNLLLDFKKVLSREPIPAPRRVDGNENQLQLLDGSMLKRLPGTPETNSYVSLKPISNSQYCDFIRATNWPQPKTWIRPYFRQADSPVVGITWFEARAYAAWLGADLPTEAEWVQAACGDRADLKYATTDGTLSHQLANFGEQLGKGRPVPVDNYPPNLAGFFGMCGNIWDWCLDAEGEHKVIRGGGYMDCAEFCKISARYRNSPIDRDCCVGFRIRYRPFAAKDTPDCEQVGYPFSHW